MNNNAISQSTTNKLYVAHSVKKEKIKKVIIQNSKATPVTAPSIPAQPYHHTNRSYYYDSIGGGYQGL